MKIKNTGVALYLNGSSQGCWKIDVDVLSKWMQIANLDHHLVPGEIRMFESQLLSLAELDLV